jgi:hypothetical protein
VATVIGSAVIPTAIANARFLPRHLLPEQGAGSSSNSVAPWGGQFCPQPAFSRPLGPRRGAVKAGAA